MKTKNLILATILFVSTLSNGQTKTASTPNLCDDLKKENEALKKSLNINQPISTVTDNEIEFKITKVKGDIKSQMVTIEFLLTNKIKNRQVGLSKSTMKIVSIEGDVLKLEKYTIPEIQSYDYNNLHIELNTDVPIKCSFTFGTLLPSNQYIKLLNIPYLVFNYSGTEETNKGALEFKDLKIDWK